METLHPTPPDQGTKDQGTTTPAKQLTTYRIEHTGAGFLSITRVKWDGSLDQLYRTLGCSCVTCFDLDLPNDKDGNERMVSVYADDEYWCRESNLDPLRVHPAVTFPGTFPIVGPILVTGLPDDEGEATSCAVPLLELAEHVSPTYMRCPF